MYDCLFSKPKKNASIILQKLAHNLGTSVPHIYVSAHKLFNINQQYNKHQNEATLCSTNITYYYKH